MAMAFAIWAAMVGMVSSTTPPKNIMTIFIDDLGFYDTEVYNPNAPTPTLGKLSHDDGMILHRHYVYKYCSPTRRAFLSGRFPIHMTGAQAPVCSNWLPLDYTLLSEKLKKAPKPFMNHFVGKGHLGYQTMDHLPINRGFDSHVGYLMGAEEYVNGYNYFGEPGHDCPGKPANCTHDFWFGQAPANSTVINEVFYSTNYYTSRAIEIIKAHDQSQSLWIHLAYQGVHAPYVEPPVWEQTPNNTGFWDQTFGSMLKVVDDGIKNVTDTLKSEGLWNDTLIMISSDNGGIGPGNNHPLRGHKATPWEGGTRVMAFLTGGYLPPALRGTTNEAFISIADWYPTLCALAGVADCSDNIVRGNATFPVDGVNVWGQLIGTNKSIAHEYLPTTEDGIIYQERWKYLTGTSSTWWYGTNDTQIPDNRTTWPCVNNPPGPPPAPSNCDAVAGYTNYCGDYCGNTFHNGRPAQDVEECAEACSQDSTCACFDFAPSRSKDKSCQPKDCSCRFHTAASPKQSGQRFNAYVKQHIVDSRTLGGSEPLACDLCTASNPCLFDLTTDPGEYVNLAKQYPAMLVQLANKLEAFNVPQANQSINTDVLERDYDCVTDIRPWWGDFAGPCCKRKTSM